MLMFYDVLPLTHPYLGHSTYVLKFQGVVK
jgi:hypothetical protein